jgi:hypothetical protein
LRIGLPIDDCPNGLPIDDCPIGLPIDDCPIGLPRLTIADSIADWGLRIPNPQSAIRNQIRNRQSPIKSAIDNRQSTIDYLPTSGACWTAWKFTSERL